MKKLFKLLLTCSAATIATLPFVAGACSNEETLPKDTKDIKKDANYKSAYSNMQRVTEVERSSELNYSLNLDWFPNIILITDTGNYDDKSFNQSSLEGILAVEDVMQNKIAISHTKPNSSNFEEQYSTALNKGKNVWVLSGFEHGNPISKFIQSNRKEMEAKKIILICIDFSLDPSIYKYVYSATFKIQESAWIVGKATGNYLSQVFANNANERQISTFGGGAYQGVVDFNRGFMLGVQEWNKENPTLKSMINKNLNRVPLDTGFEPSNKLENSVIESLGKVSVNGKSFFPKVLLPVAGPAVNVALTKMQTSDYANTAVICVDVDQANGYSSTSPEHGKFLTSITKHISQAVYDIILATVYNIDPKHLLGENKTSIVLDKGIAENWVGYTTSHLKDPAKAKLMNDALALAKTQFDALTPEQKEALRSDVLDGKKLSYQDFLNKLLEKINN
ncbi:BMP family ABC transporter substrate-binding protein [Mycoplasmopsis gallopavonis]|uniref:ABC transporter substrate-binding protein PnrA-like domain-containing protein n=1 Tax=Mycoplasmopsis gallopavonis TaxID=76629 RepID=A0A449AYY0_9BACT|nr:BMP family ABC transporter substrate-binding protein [Mycoplasmopsis gallopavonis]RIV16638.1 BMP family ABC transporter substrate-binding protein [Mycoplasmopsis gallopavonis]VEU72694.1 Uncharacterised protein [Mycoplasmopsis gallopavonis]